MSAERDRLVEADTGGVPWRRWGPYLSERQWGTVREHWGAGGDPWSSFPHDHARSRAYRWGEDGLAGVCDDRQLLCLALALWNGRDPILKERLFGLANGEGNHGEDVKECYFYLDATPTSSYLRMLYKYPQSEFPYERLVSANRARGRGEPEYELPDTGVFAGDRYFDVVVEYAKAAPEDLLMQVTVRNRGSEDAQLHVLPTLWFRHTWSWAGEADRPLLRATRDGAGTVIADHPGLGRRWARIDGPADVLITGNETNDERIFGWPNATPYVKDGIDRAVVHGDRSALDPGGVNTKVAWHRVLHVAAGGSAIVRFRLCDKDPGPRGFDGFGSIMRARRREADEFWHETLGDDGGDDDRNVARQALSGVLWSRQYYSFDVERWLRTASGEPTSRHEDWRHLVADDVICMPDKWEYPWFAAWDLAFHAVALAPVDPAFAKSQVSLLLGERYLHPNGQLPAYEWNFSDVNPPVHAWAALLVYEVERLTTGRADRAFLEGTFHKLMRNFDWWLNRVDAQNRNVFGGGFLGLDNATAFDRTRPLPGGGDLDQADGTAWMALYCQNLAAIAIELARENPVYLQQARTLFQKFSAIAAASGPGTTSLWDETDGFFYDVLRRTDGTRIPLRVRSVVGLLPLAASTVVPARVSAEFPELVDEGREGARLFALFDESRLRRILERMLDEHEFLAPHGIRSLSRWHADNPYVLHLDGQTHCVRYAPAESDTATFGGNSNWRGPVWMPVNVMLIRALVNLHAYFGDGFTVQCPTGSGRWLTLYEVAKDIADRLLGLFRLDAGMKRRLHGPAAELQHGEHWRDLVPFPEYFDGDTGRGLGASHQTGWTALVALLPMVFARGPQPPLT